MWDNAMNILFLTLVNISGFQEKQNIYADQCRELVRRGHRMHIVCPDETGTETVFVPYENGSGVLKVNTGRVQKTNLIRKGIATLLVGTRFKDAIRRYLKGQRYDLVMYSTPPITLVNIVNYIKKRDGAQSYLLLKDIFPQNAVDLGMMSKRGLKAPVYWYFRYMERKLYAVSDRIGCMSEANAAYIQAHEPQIPVYKIHISPNSFEPETICVTPEQKRILRQRYGIPVDKKVFIYGGNIGRPQGVPFLIECMKAVAQEKNSYFVICGTGTELGLLQEYVRQSEQYNLKLIPGLPRQEYEDFVGCCDVGLIFLDYRFTIPNFPSRLLSYMQKSMPVIACTDLVSDVGQVVEAGRFGLWCPSNDSQKFVEAVRRLCDGDTEILGQNAATWLKKYYNVRKVADIILNENAGVME